MSEATNYELNRMNVLMEEIIDIFAQHIEYINEQKRSLEEQDRQHFLIASNNEETSC